MISNTCFKKIIAKLHKLVEMLVSTGGVSCQQADYQLECRVNSFEQTKWTFVLRFMVEGTLDEIESRKKIFSVVKTLNGRNNYCPKTMTLVCTNFEVRNISCKQ